MCARGLLVAMVVGLAVVLGAIAPAWGQTAGMLSFQGLLKDAGGVPVNGAVTLQFRIYDAQAAGALVDMDGSGVVEDVVGKDAKQVSATATKGIVSTKFGPVSAKAFNGSARWLEVRVNGTALSRTEMAGAPATAEQMNRPGAGAPAINFDASENVVFRGANSNSAMKFSKIGALDIASDRDGGASLSLLYFGSRSADNDAIINVYDAVNPAHSCTMSWREGELSFANYYTTPLRILRNDVEMRVARITGGSDLAEPFVVGSDEATKRQSDGGGKQAGDGAGSGAAVNSQRDTRNSPLPAPQPGHVVVIDPENPGQLKLATQPYDRKVAGVISGANGLSPGVILKADDTKDADAHPVAMAGRVWCWCDASHGAITPGDLLTTSATAGHAMRAGEKRDFPRGCIIGKAMSRLEKGKGLVLVLVQPQ